MKTPPFDFHRCAPEKPDERCRTCLRWEYMLGQTFGPRTPLAVGRSSSQDAGCTYIKIEYDQGHHD